MTTHRFMDSWDYEYRHRDTDAEDLDAYRDGLERLLYESGIEATPDSKEMTGRYSLSDLRDRHPDELVLSTVGRDYADGHYDSLEGTLMLSDETVEDHIEAIENDLDDDRSLFGRLYDSRKDRIDAMTDWYDRGERQLDGIDAYGELFHEAHSRQRKELLVNPVNGMFGLVAGGMMGAAGLASGDPGIAVAGYLVAEGGLGTAAAQELLEEGRRGRFQDEAAGMVLDRIEDDLDDPSIEIRRS
jgi:hypothetical protein